MSEGATTTSSFQLPPPVTAKDGSAEGQTGVGQRAAPSLIALAAGLFGMSSNRPRAELLFIGSGIVTLGLYFIVPPKDSENAHPIVCTFLRRVPNIFTTFGCILIVLGIGNAFPSETALIPLFSFISFAALAALFGTVLSVWITTSLYGAALVSLATFVVLAFMA